jgi:hypothetical protein
MLGLARLPSAAASCVDDGACACARLGRAVAARGRNKYRL